MSAIPLWLRAVVCALVALACGLFIAHGVRQIKADGAAERDAATAAATAKQAAADAKVTEQRVNDQARIAHDATVQADTARVAAASADRARDALRVRFDAYVRTNILAADPAASGAGEADPIGVLSGVFDRMEDAAGRYAAEADANRIAGLACEAAYDALMP